MMESDQPQAKVQSDSQGKTQRIVSGGATAFPTYDGPLPINPQPSRYLHDFVVRAVRGPLICVALCHLAQPIYLRWLRALLARGWSEERAFAIQAQTIHAAIYFGMFAFFEGLTHFKLLQQYKVFRTPGQEPTFRMEAKTLAEFVLSQIFNFYAIGAVAFRGMLKFGGSSGLSPLPSSWRMFATLAFSNLWNRVFFALAHRLLHAGPLYRHVHKKHHEYVGTVTIASENAHPIEHLFANAIPTLGGCILLGAHPLVFLVWLSWRLEETNESHSGYCFAGSWLHQVGLTNADQAAYHDHHHMVNKGNFGMDSLVDWAMGTNQHWIANGENEGYVEQAKKRAAAAAGAQEE